MNLSIDYEKHFRMYCEENSLTINLSFDMPEGFETANGTFDPTVNTLFISIVKTVDDFDDLLKVMNTPELTEFQYLVSGDEWTVVLDESIICGGTATWVSY